MSKLPDRITTRFPVDQIEALTKKAKETGMTEAELIRLAVMSFLSKEDALSDYLSAISALEEKLAVMQKRQEDFTRVIGNTLALKDSEKPADLRQKFADRITQICDAVN